MKAIVDCNTFYCSSETIKFAFSGIKTGALISPTNAPGRKFKGSEVKLFPNISPSVIHH